MYLSPGTWVRFPRKAKTPIVKGVGEDREVAVLGSPKARAVTKKAPFYVTARAFGDPSTATSRSSPTPFTIGVFAFRGNRTHVPGDKYIVHSISTTNWATPH
ncbi:hypothetical protein QL285_083414 [Trifolium repens]|nr:hypothetical protein QL285_083414 [Trifolium repens]